MTKDIRECQIGPSSEPKWPDIEIGYLILESDDFIVFIDKDLDVDWLTSDKYDTIGPKDPCRQNEILNSAASLECLPNDHHRKNVRLNFKRMIGEGVARSLDHDYESAERILEKARLYLTERNIETARFWQLSTGCILGLIAAIVELIIWTMRYILIQDWGRSTYFLFFSALAGSFGAVLSMIFRMGSSFPTSEAPKRLHVLEAISRVFAGCLSGLLVASAVEIGLVLHVSVESGHLHLTMLASSIASGASERWAPSLIAKMEGNPKHNVTKRGKTE